LGDGYTVGFRQGSLMSSLKLFRFAFL